MCQDDRAGENNVKLSQRLVKTWRGSSAHCLSSLRLPAELLRSGVLPSSRFCQKLLEKPAHGHAEHFWLCRASPAGPTRPTLYQKPHLATTASRLEQSRWRSWTRQAGSALRGAAARTRGPRGAFQPQSVEERPRSTAEPPKAGAPAPAFVPVTDAGADKGRSPDGHSSYQRTWLSSPTLLGRGGISRATQGLSEPNQRLQLLAAKQRVGEDTETMFP